MSRLVLMYRVGMRVLRERFNGASVAKMPCSPGEKVRRGGDLLMKIVSEGNWTEFP